MEFLEKFHFLDILTLLVFIRIGYIAFMRGILNELMKLAGLFLASFFSLQYYPTLLGSFFETGPFAVETTRLHLASFLIIFFVTIIIIALIRRVILLLFKKESYSPGERRCSLVVGLVRASFLMSIILYAVSLSRDAPIKPCITERLFKSMAPRAYVGSFSVYQKINPSVALNKEVKEYYEAQRNLQRDDKKRDRTGSAREKSNNAAS